MILKQTLSTLIPEVLDALWECMQHYIKTPNTAQEWQAVADAFPEKWNLPYCVGAIGEKHIMIKAPAGGRSVQYLLTLLYKVENSDVIIKIITYNCFYFLLQKTIQKNMSSCVFCYIQRI